MSRRLLLALAAALAAAALGAVLWVGHWTRDYEAALRATEFDRADAALDRLSWLGRDTVEQRMLLANGYASSGNIEAAEKQLLRSVEIEPSEQAWEGLGLLRMAREDWEGVVEAHEASRAAGGGIRLLRQAARAWLELGDRDAAVSVMDTAEREHPDAREVHLMAANLAIELGDWRRVVHHYGEALRIDPELHYAANNLAWFLATEDEIRDPERALSLARRALQGEQADDPNYLETLARAQAAAGEAEQAIATARRALELAEATGDAELRERLVAWLAEASPET